MPVVTPVAAVIPVAQAVPSPPSRPAEARRDVLVVVPPSVARRGGGARRARWLTGRFVALNVLIVGVLAVGGITALGATGHLPAPLNKWWDFIFAGKGGMAGGDARKNYRFAPLEKPWAVDGEAKRELKADIAFRRTGPSRWVAVVSKDYKDRNPRISDLYDEIILRLRVHIPDLEYQALTGTRQLAGEPAAGIEFQGTTNSVMMNGECLMLAHQGLGYWFLTWSPLSEKEDAAEDWRVLRERFTFLNEREGWQEKLRKQVTANGENAPYLIRYAESIWDKQDLATFDQAADLALLGNDPTEIKHVSKTATVQLLVLPKQDDLKSAAAKAREYFLKMQKESGYPDTTLEVLTDKDGDLDRKSEVGNREGQIIHLKVINGDNRKRFALLAVVLLPQNTLVFVGECDFQRRDYWEQEFLPLLNEIRVK